MDETTTVSPLTKALIRVYEARKSVAPPGTLRIKVSRTVSAAAYLLEKIRNAVEFHDQHIARRAAIERIIRRRLMFNPSGEGIAAVLIKELIWAKYLPNASVPETAIPHIQEAINKYLLLKQKITAKVKLNEKAVFSNWIFEVASCEVEDRLHVTVERDATINYMYQLMRPTITVNKKKDEERDLQVYIATSQALAKSERALLRYQLLRLYVPDIEEKDESVVPSLSVEMPKIIHSIEGQLTHPVLASLYRYIRRNVPPLLILQEVLETHRSTLDSILSSPEKLAQAVDDICTSRYKDTGKRLRSMAIRSVIYVFITKMVLAIVIEVPADRFLQGKVDIIPLAVNLVFPPLLMFLITLAVSPPGQANTKRILAKIEEIIGEVPNEDGHTVDFSSKKVSLRPFLTFIFTLIYSGAFLLSFGMIFYALGRLDFSIASQSIFVFFLCVIMFFGFRARQTAQEYHFEEKEGLFGPIFDFLLLPILRVGQWLSSEVSASVANIFTVIFDVVLEMPLKALFGILEEWFSFLRTKKEEIS